MEAAVTWLRSAFGVTDAVQLVNFPKWTPLLERLQSGFGWPVVYDCLDIEQAFGELHPLNDAHHEEPLARGAALVVTLSQTLFDVQRSYSPNTILIPNAVDYEVFTDVKPAGMLEDLKRPVIGFFGAFSEWLDRGWIAEVANRFPDWSFVYIGRPGFARGASRSGWRVATAAENVTVLPQVELPTLAKYLAEFDVCTMPFRDLAITRSMNAVKIFEKGVDHRIPHVGGVVPIAGRGGHQQQLRRGGSTAPRLRGREHLAASHRRTDRRTTADY